MKRGGRGVDRLSTPHPSIPSPPTFRMGGALGGGSGIEDARGRRCENEPDRVVVRDGSFRLQAAMAMEKVA